MALAFTAFGGSPAQSFVLTTVTKLQDTLPLSRAPAPRDAEVGIFDCRGAEPVKWYPLGLVVETSFGRFESGHPGSRHIGGKQQQDDVFSKWRMHIRLHGYHLCSMSSYT